MLPVTIGLGLINFNLTIDLVDRDARLAARRRRPQLRLPALHAAAGPLLGRRHGRALPARSRGSRPAATRRASRARSSTGARTIVFLLLPGRRDLDRAREPIVRLIFQHGSFTSADTSNVAGALVAFSLGLVANGIALLLTRAFFALQEARIPTRVAAGEPVPEPDPRPHPLQAVRRRRHRARDGHRHDVERDPACDRSCAGGSAPARAARSPARRRASRSRPSTAPRPPSACGGRSTSCSAGRSLAQVVVGRSRDSPRGRARTSRRAGSCTSRRWTSWRRSPGAASRAG